MKMRLIGPVLVLVVLAVSQSNAHGVKGFPNSENSWSHSYSSASASASSFSSSYSSGTGPKDFPHAPSASAFASAQANANAGGGSANAGAIAGAEAGDTPPGGIGSGSEIYKGSSINSGALAGAQAGGYRPGGGVGPDIYKGSSINSGALAGAQVGGYRPGGGVGSETYKGSSINSGALAGAQAGGYRPGGGAESEIYKGSSVNSDSIVGPQVGGSPAQFGPNVGAGPEIYKESSINSGTLAGAQAGGSSAGYGQGAGAGFGVYNKGTSINSGPIAGPQAAGSSAGYGPGAGAGPEIYKESTINSEAIADAQAGGSSAGYGPGTGPGSEKISGTESGLGVGLEINGVAADKGTDGHKGGHYEGNLATSGADSKVDAGIGTFGSIGFGASPSSGNRASGSQDNTFINNVISSDGSIENNDKGSGSDTSSGCCKGPFPGPKGSIHDYKPAPPGGGGPDPAWLTSGTGANAVSNSGYSIGSYNTRPESSGLTYNLVNSLPGASGSIYTSKPAIGYSKQPSYSGIGTTEVHNVVSTFPGPTAGISHSKPATSVSSSSAIDNSNTQSVISTLPGPTGSIYASKPATSVSSSSSTFGPSETGVGGTSVVGTLPGPAGSIYDSKPAGGISFGGSSSGSYNQGASSGGHVVISNLPGPSGSIYEQKPVVPSTTDYISGHGSEGAGISSVSSEGAFGTDVPSKPISQVIPTLPGRPGSIYESKPIAAIGCSGTSCHKPVIPIAVTPERFSLKPISKPISSTYISGTGCLGSSCGFPQPPVYKPTAVIVEQVPLIPVHSKPIVGCLDGSCGGYKPVVGCSGGYCGNNKPVAVGCIGGSCEGYEPAVDIPLVRDKTTYFSSEGCYGSSCKPDRSPQKPNYELLPPAIGPDCKGKDKDKPECSGFNGVFAPTERGSTSTDIAGNVLKPAVSSGPTVQAVIKDSSTESGGYGGSLSASAISAENKPGSKPIKSTSGFDSYANAEASASAQSEAGSQSGHYTGIIGPAVPSVSSQTNIQTNQASSTDIGSGSGCKYGAAGCSISNENIAPYTSSYEITKPGTGDLPVISDASADSYKKGPTLENKGSTFGIGASYPSRPVSIGGSIDSYGSSHAGSHGFINKPTTGCIGGSCNYPDKINVPDNISKGPGVSNFGSNYFGSSNSGSLSGANYGCSSGSCGGLSPESKSDAHASYGDKNSKPHSFTSSSARVPISACIGNTCAPLSPQVGGGAISGGYSGSGSSPHGSDNGFAIGGVLIHKADGSVSSGKDNLGSYGSGGIKDSGSGSGCLRGSCGSLDGSKASSGSYSGSYSSGGGAGPFGFGGGFGGNLGSLGGFKGGSSSFASATSSNPHGGVGQLGDFFKGGIEGAFSKAGAFSGAGAYANSGAVAKSGAYSSSFASAMSNAEAGSH